MKLAISNIAWDTEENESIVEILNRLNVGGIEIAPTKLWNRPVEVEQTAIVQEKQKWTSKHIDLVAMQSLLFGQSNMNLFGQEDSRNAMLDYLKEIIRLAGYLGTKSLVFGSPKNRIADELSKSEQMNIAIPFLGSLVQLPKKTAFTSA